MATEAVDTEECSHHGGAQVGCESTVSDEFLSLLRLTDFKEDIMNMNMGTTLKDIAAASVENGHDPDTYLDAIKTITRSQANRLSKFLMRWHERRKAKIENIKKKRSKRKLKLDAAKDDKGDE